MQFQIRIDDGNFVTVDASLSNVGQFGGEGVPEVGAAVVTNGKLSDLTQDQLFDVVGQCIDILTAKAADPVQPGPDWRDAFRRGQDPNV